MTLFLAATAANEAAARDWPSGGVIFLQLVVVMFLVILNGFFVASEFAIVKVRSSQLEALEEEGEARAPFARHVTAHLDAWDPLESTCRHASLSIL